MSSYMEKLARVTEKQKDKMRMHAETTSALGTILGAVTGPVGSSVAGFAHGLKTNHGVVGTFLGPSGVNGANAKDTDVSTFLSNARGSAIAGGVVGGVISIATKSKFVPSTIKGAIGGAVSGATGYGLGYMLGSKQDKKKTIKRLTSE